MMILHDFDSHLKKIKSPTGVLSDSVGYLDPKIMGIDIRIALLGASLT